MRLIDFLILLLQAHAQTLQRLAALMGEEILLEVLESQDDAPAPTGALRNADPSYFYTPAAESLRGLSASYAELEGAVRELDLPEVLEFHLWAYPYYRRWIESSTELHARAVPEKMETLLSEALRAAQDWVQALPLAPDFGKRVEAAANVPWIRFRAESLKKAGFRRLGTV